MEEKIKVAHKVDVNLIKGDVEGRFYSESGFWGRDLPKLMSLSKALIQIKFWRESFIQSRVFEEECYPNSGFWVGALPNIIFLWEESAQKKKCFLTYFWGPGWFPLDSPWNFVTGAQMFVNFRSSFQRIQKICKNPDVSIRIVKNDVKIVLK